jgi:hypothetical protein
MNGSSADDLSNPRLAAIDHLMDAIEALKQVAPHGRDYIGDPSRLDLDRDIHFHRIVALRDIREELFAEVLHIKEQS